MHFVNHTKRAVNVKALAASLAAAIALIGPGLVATTSAAPNAGSRLDPTLKTHPLLQVGAQKEPDKKVRVIVQTERRDDDLHAIARSVDAEVDEQFSFVQAMVLEVPQKRALELARNPHVRYVSLDGPVRHQGSNFDASHLLTSYPGTISVPNGVWNGGIPSTGKGVAVAVLDSGVNAQHPDFYASNVKSVNVNKTALNTEDGHGHGTHVVGIINGRSSDGHYIGIAPDATVYSIKISDDSGSAHEADMLRGLQWVYDNRGSTNIKAVNLSVASATAESYLTSVVDAAVEQLWLNGITVVVAAGNRGAAVDAEWYAPANDPFVITVGALDDNLTTAPGDDSLATFSGRGMTQDGYNKPDVVAPGRKIYAPLASSSATLATLLPTHISADGRHIRLSGTSMAAPVVTGVVALVKQVFPNMTPDQMKWLFVNNLHPYNAQPDKAGMVNPQQMLTSAKSTSTWGTANKGVMPNVGINTSNGTVQWGTSYWDTSYWDTSYWDTSYWDVMSNYD